MHYAIVTVPAAPVRKKANHRAEMSNQLLFGESVKILKEKGKWLQVESLYDGYRGWLTPHMVSYVREKTATTDVNKLASAFLNTITVNNIAMQIPAGSSLIGLTKTRGGFDGFQYQYTGLSVAAARIKSKQEALIKNAYSWLNAPYMWGGKTILGVDCSGYAQTMYKLVGIPIPRDAKQQVKKGKWVKRLEDAMPGDLAFFDEKGKIVHVGILLDAKTIIHSAGKVRIDAIDEKGIVNTDSGLRTHQLKRIKRFL